jgi:hypothetical protein
MRYITHLLSMTNIVRGPYSNFLNLKDPCSFREDGYLQWSEGRWGRTNYLSKVAVS